MKRYLIILACGCLLAQQAVLARASGGGRSWPHAGPAPQACQADPGCAEHRRLRNLRMREAERNGDLGFDPVKHQSRLLPPSPDGHARTVPSKPNFWQDKRRQEQEQNPSE
ncbi:hypothetical protein CXB49_20910 [Chromobacterium sp. ATCC 53434]|uniref:hypothetical protein n=1 Tax=Chromobacterium TaxID=535 RepID=UPI000C78EF91|nr:hypothetical protein [Chromobacterium sp. ATCC 53434]AUH53077.1 hypothetical protein CXB49_20910 [Chromobacterium sp. ATCC 53434]